MAERYWVRYRRPAGRRGRVVFDPEQLSYQDCDQFWRSTTDHAERQGGDIAPVPLGHFHHHDEQAKIAAESRELQAR